MPCQRRKCASVMHGAAGSRGGAPVEDGRLPDDGEQGGGAADHEEHGADAVLHRGMPHRAGRQEAPPADACVEAVRRLRPRVVPCGAARRVRHGKRGMRYALSCKSVSLLFFLTRKGMRGREGRSVGACAAVVGALQRCAVCCVLSDGRAWRAVSALDLVCAHACQELLLQPQQLRSSCAGDKPICIAAG